MTLTLDGLDVPFGGAPGLAGVSLDAAAGERVVLVGASGAGKTSLLRAVAGLGRMSAGTVRIGGVDVTGLPAERRDAVYLQQTPLLFPHMTVAGNVAFPLRVRGIDADERHRRAADALASVRLADFGARMPHELSGGQRHRAALARAVVARPKVLLLDEPLAALDPSLRAEVRDALLAVNAAYGPALLLVTHDLDEAALIADRVGVLIDRRLAQVAAPEELLRFPASLAVARFLGGFVELSGEMRNGIFESALGRWPVARATVREGRAIGVIRSDGVLIGGEGVPARVQSVRVLAARTQVVVAAGDVTIEVSVGAGGAPRTGDAVRLAAVPGLMSVFGRP